GPAGAAIAVRMARCTGEAVQRDGDYFGVTVNRAARLRALAGGGQILVAQSTARVVDGQLPDGVELIGLGEQVLRDLAQPEQVFGLAGPGLTVAVLAPAESGRVELALPAPLAGGAESVFVGREAEGQPLDAVLSDVIEGRRRTVLVGGEPGVGKSRLLAEAARRAHARGALVLYGRCDE